MQGKLFYKIREVSEITQLESYVIRFWETEFPTLRPKKSRGNQRIYTQKEIDLLIEIKRLLYIEKLTIAGARKKLQHPNSVKKSGPNQKALQAIKKDLEDLLQFLG